MDATKNQAGDIFPLPAGLGERIKRTCVKAFLGYRQFIKLKLQQEDWDATILSPSIMVDQVWHQHILDVGKYVKACQEYTGGHLIDHNPDGMMDAAAKAERIKNTKLCLKTLCGKDNIDPEVWNFGEEGGDKTVGQKRKAATQPLRKTLIVSVRDQLPGPLARFEIERDAPLSELVATYFRENDIHEDDQEHYRIFQNGYRINTESTAAEVGLEEGDILDFLLAQSGC
ncbi:MAG: hypothetical protein SGARI_001802 [Bacillariaceae sp.]